MIFGASTAKAWSLTLATGLLLSCTIATELRRLEIARVALI